MGIDKAQPWRKIDCDLALELALGSAFVLLECGYMDSMQSLIFINSHYRYVVFALS